MSSPSSKAELFKLWLAQVGSERIQEIENPKLREQLTDEWKGRGVQEGIEYSILTAEISKATFGMVHLEY